jgi:hypothetical protein
LSTYLDASVVVSLFTDDVLADNAAARVSRASRPIFVSDFGVAEFASGLGLRVRRAILSPALARRACDLLDDWLPASCRLVSVAPADIALATAWLRRFDLNLRAPDAIHLAIAARLGAPVATFDFGMEAAARVLGVALAPG